MVLAVRSYVALGRGQLDAAIASADELCAVAEGGPDARRRLLIALEHLDRQRPDSPWTLCLAARLLIADQNLEPARMAIDLCRKRCADPPCRHYVEVLDALLAPKAED